MKITQRRQRHIRLTFVLAISLLAGARGVAHEIGTTRVSLLAERDRYRIVIVTDAAALLDKLVAAAGRSVGKTGDPAALKGRFEQLSEIFVQRVAIALDGRPVRPAVAWAVAQTTADASSPLVMIELTGPVPRGTGRLTWTYSWTFASYAFTVRHDAGAESTTEWLEGGQSSTAVQLDGPSAGPLSSLRLASRYLLLGFTHILPNGLDHMLFVLGLFLLNRRMRPILLQVSAFTVAHSLTLASSILGLLSLRPHVVEPLIAISIAYIAVENLFFSDSKPWRVLLVFAFGLIHGLGFAGALEDVGLPRGQLLPALVGFNAGVEAGQLAVIGMAFLLVGRPYGTRAWYRRRIVVPASAFIACLGVYWTFERLV